MGTVAPEIQPVVVLQSDVFELRKLRRQHSWSFAGDAVSGVGVVGGTGLINPAGSGILTVIERISISFESQDTVQQEVNIRLDSEANIAADLPNIITDTLSPRDTRLIPAAGSTFPGTQCRGGQTAAPSGFFLSRWFFPAAATGSNAHIIEASKDIAIFPGFGVAVFQNAVGAGATLLANFDFYERPLEAAEQNG